MQVRGRGSSWGAVRGAACSGRGVQQVCGDSRRWEGSEKGCMQWEAAAAGVRGWQEGAACRGRGYLQLAGQPEWAACTCAG